MTALWLVVGIGCLAVGTFALVRAPALTARERRRKGSVTVGPAGWRVFAGLQLAVGAVVVLAAAVG